MTNVTPSLTGIAAEAAKDASVGILVFAVLLALSLAGCFYYRRSRRQARLPKVWLSAGARTADSRRILDLSEVTPSEYPALTDEKLDDDDDAYASSQRLSTGSRLSASASASSRWGAGGLLGSRRLGGGSGSPKIDPSPEVSPASSPDAGKERKEHTERKAAAPCRTRRASASELGDELGPGRHAKPRTRMHSVAFGTGIATRGPEGAALAAAPGDATKGGAPQRKKATAAELADEQRATGGRQARASTAMRTVTFPSEQAAVNAPLEDGASDEGNQAAERARSETTVHAPSAVARTQMRKERSREEATGAANAWRRSSNVERHQQAPWWSFLMRGSSLLTAGEEDSAAAGSARSPIKTRFRALSKMMSSQHVKWVESEDQQREEAERSNGNGAGSMQQSTPALTSSPKTQSLNYASL